MTSWPDTLNVAPIREWPGALTASRKSSPFRAGLTDTLELLDREIYNLADTRAHQDSAELLVAVLAGAFRRDGRPRADARAEHPGVVFSMQTRHGQLSYPCDTFTTWQDNLRAIALALEALRKVDRYAVTKHGEQYRGFLAIEATVAVAGFADAPAAMQWLIDLTGHVDGATPEAPQARRRAIIRKAMRRAHPDSGGDETTFQRVMLAEAKLREVGLL